MAGAFEGFTEVDCQLYIESLKDANAPLAQAGKRVEAPGRDVPLAQAGKRLEAPGRDVRKNDGERLAEDEERPANRVLDLETIPGNVDIKSASPEVLKVLQARQKALEEHNKKTKNLLAKILNDRRKQTTEEANRLENLQKELYNLDLRLSNDVGILRDQIEFASIEFGEAQKRFAKAEKEYLNAKGVLFTKLEKKELLTKHLCTIIEQNELRKAQKLSELMEKLQIGEKKDNIPSGL